MILCGRHAAAREAADEYLAAWPISQAYLQSEACWRHGDITLAMQLLKGPASGLYGQIASSPCQVSASAAEHHVDAIHDQNDEHMGPLSASPQHPYLQQQQQQQQREADRDHANCATGKQHSRAQPGDLSSHSSQEAFGPSIRLDSHNAIDSQQADSRIDGQREGLKASSCETRLDSRQPMVTDISLRCRALADFLAPLKTLQAAAEEAHEDGRTQS